MGNRYDNRIIRTNAQEIHKDLLDRRGLRKVKQYTTPTLNDITAQERASLQRVEHVWKIGDRLYKLAAQYYGDPELWWLISWYNQKPTESHFKIGDIVLIPLPLEDVSYLFSKSKNKRNS
jgi:nucleoid-associated protein YgaU